MEKRILHLTLHRRFFEEVARRRKVEEYRNITDYWKRRLLNDDGSVRVFDEVHFRNGYGRSKPSLRVEWKSMRVAAPIDTDFAVLMAECFAIELGRVLEFRFCQDPLLEAAVLPVANR